MDLTLTQWLAQVPNTSVAACFNTTGTMPTGVTPAEAMHQLMTGYRKAQEVYNAGATAPPFIAASAPIIYGTIVLTDDSGDYRTVEHKLTVRQYFDPDNAGAATGITII